MLGKSHVKIALGMSLFTANPNFIVGSVIGSLLPDVDSKKSRLGRYVPLNRNKWFKENIKHRGATHSVVGVIAFMFTMSLFFDVVSVTGLVLGYISHIIADMFTVKGVELYWLPSKEYLDNDYRKVKTKNGYIKKPKHVRFAQLETGCFKEWVVSTLFLVIGIILFVRCVTYVL